MSHPESAASVFAELLALVDARASDPFSYYQTSGRVVAESSFDGAVTFRLVLVHEPISEEAAVEDDRLDLTLRPDDGTDATEVIVAEASAFLDDHWR